MIDEHNAGVYLCFIVSSPFWVCKTNCKNNCKINPGLSRKFCVWRLNCSIRFLTFFNIVKSEHDCVLFCISDAIKREPRMRTARRGSRLKSKNNMDATTFRFVHKTKSKPSVAGSIWKGTATKWVRGDLKKSRRERYVVRGDVANNPYFDTMHPLWL